MTRKIALTSVLFFVILSLPLFWLGGHADIFAKAHAATPETAVAQTVKSIELQVAEVQSRGFAYLAIALVVGLSCVGAGYAVGAVGSAAMGAVTERPELIGRALIFVGLAEGIAIYGLLIAIMLLNMVGK